MIRLPEEQREHDAMMEVMAARMHLAAAIRAYEAAGYGDHVTQPLRDALPLIEFSIREVATS